MLVFNCMSIEEVRGVASVGTSKDTESKYIMHVQCQESQYIDKQAWPEYN